MNLYWVTTDDPGEDWFILASTAKAARHFQERREEYDPGDAHAELILRAVDSRSPPRARHAQLEHLRKLCLEILNLNPKRA